MIEDEELNPKVFKRYGVPLMKQRELIEITAKSSGYSKKEIKEVLDHVIANAVVAILQGKAVKFDQMATITPRTRRRHEHQEGGARDVLYLKAFITDNFSKLSKYKAKGVLQFVEDEKGTTRLALTTDNEGESNEQNT